MTDLLEKLPALPLEFYVPPQEADWPKWLVKDATGKTILTPNSSFLTADQAQALVSLVNSAGAMREALRPFAKAGGQVPVTYMTHGPSEAEVADDEPVVMSVVGVTVGDVTVADLDRARAALALIEEGK